MCSKHANFPTRNTGWNDVASQSLDGKLRPPDYLFLFRYLMFSMRLDAFRSQDWWSYVQTQNYVCDAFMSGIVWTLTSGRFGLIIAPMLVVLLVLRIGGVPRATLLLFRRACVKHRKQVHGCSIKTLHMHMDVLGFPWRVGVSYLRCHHYL